MSYLKCDIPNKVSYPATNISEKSFIEKSDFKTKLGVSYFGNYPLTDEYWLALFYPIPEGSQVLETVSNRILTKNSKGEWISGNVIVPEEDRKIYGLQWFLNLSCPIRPLHL